MAGSPPNFHKMDSRSACIQGVLKVKVKGHVIRELSGILGMSYSVIDGLVKLYYPGLIAGSSYRSCAGVQLCSILAVCDSLRVLMA